MGTTAETDLVETWHQVLDRHARVIGALEHALAEHQLGVSEYEVLEALADQAEQGCRMHDLAGSSHLSQSALSRVVAAWRTTAWSSAPCAPTTAAGSTPISPTRDAPGSRRPAPPTGRC